MTILDLAKQRSQEQEQLGLAAALQQRQPLAQQLEQDANALPAQSPASASPAPQLPPQKAPPSWDEQRAALNQHREKLDEQAQNELQQLNKRTDIARRALDEGKLRPEEYQRITQTIHTQAEQYPWKQHSKLPGSNIGDVIEDDGIQKVRTPDGLQPVGFTADYIKKHTVPLGESGNIVVPVAPGQPMKIISRREWERNASDERTGIAETHKKIQDTFDAIQKMAKASKAITDGQGNVVGHQPFTADELNDMSIEAAKIVSKQYLQARSVYKTVIDGAGRTKPGEAAVRGEAVDPFVKEKKIKQLEAQKQQLMQQAQAAAATQGAAGAPVPSPTPVPDNGGGVKWGMFDTDNLASGTASNRMSPEASAQASVKRSAELARLGARVQGGDSFASKLAAGATAAKPMMVASKEEMNKRFGGKATPDGFVVSLPDGRRYIKDAGKFWQIPWTAADMASPTMISHSPGTAGQEIIDPSTGQPAMGISQQLDQGKSAMVDQYSPDKTDVATTGPPSESPTEPSPAAEKNLVGPPGPGVSPAAATPAVPPPQQNAIATIVDPEQSLLRNKKLRLKIINPTVELKPGEKPKGLKPGDTFRMPNGAVFIYRGPNRADGPYPASIIRRVKHRLLQGQFEGNPVSAFGMM